MRILVLCHEWPPIGGGASVVAAALAKEYAARGHTVAALTMGFPSLPERVWDNGCEVIRIDCGRRRKEMTSPWEGLVWARRCYQTASRLHEAHPFDVVHAHFIMPAGIVAHGLWKRHRTPFVITAHGSDVPGFNRERLKFAHWLVRPWWKRVSRAATRLTFPSASLQDLHRTAMDGCRTLVIHNGIDTRRFRPRAKEPRILLCSRLVERKGFHVFLEAIRALELPGWSVDIVGDGPMRERLQALAGQCRIPVRMLGWLGNNDPRLAELYGRAAIFVFPSEWENFSLSALEGMSAGCAVVATEAGGNRETIADTGIVVPVGDREALRRAVTELVGDGERCAVLGRRGRARAEQFAWPRIATQYLAELEQIAVRGGRACEYA